MKVERDAIAFSGVTGMRQEYSSDSGELHELGFMLKLQSGGWITLTVIRERAREG